MTRSTAKNLKTSTGTKAKGSAEGLYKSLEMQFAKAYKEALIHTSQSNSKKTRMRYKDSMNKFIRFCAERFRLQNLAKISEKHVIAYVEQRRFEGINEKTLKNDLAAVRFYYPFTGGKNELPDNKVLKINKTPQGKVDRAWSKSEFDNMLRLAYEYGHKDIFYTMQLARYAGLRIHECTRLSKKDADKAIMTGVLRVKGKGGRIREVSLRKEAIEVLKQASSGLKEKDKLFIPKGEKTHVVIQHIQKFITRHRDKVFSSKREAPMTFHGLRHTFAREEYLSRVKEAQNRNEIREAKLKVSEMLGHGRPEVTDIYLGSEVKKAK